MPHRPHDIVLLGVTGFTGRQVAAWFARHVPRTEVRWALAARNPDKLAAVRVGLGPDFADVPLLTVDTLDADAVDAMAAATRVVLTTVGPYARYGDRVVDACVQHGTDYVDITGETPWVRRVIARHHDRAAADGTRIVPFCGFDSIPSDLGVWMVARHLLERHGQGTREVRSAYRAKGGFNGGTLASALNLMAAERPRDMADPFTLNPPGRKPGPAVGRSQDLVRTFTDPDLGPVAPFFMAPVNTRVVRRSDALLHARGAGYGADFAYQEAMSVTGLGMGLGVLAGMAMFPIVGKVGPLRRLAARLGPAPGEGPTEAQMDGGWFSARFIGEGDDGARVIGTVKGQGDPGNRCTVRMLCVCALLLVQDRERLPAGGGVLTPAVAFGDVLLERLRERGMTWEVEDAG
jgi:short subunit dehydrogenase-like uncharacterized protein